MLPTMYHVRKYLKLNGTVKQPNHLPLVYRFDGSKSIIVVWQQSYYCFIYSKTSLKMLKLNLIFDY